MHGDARGCTGMHGDAEGCTGMHGDARGCTGMLRDARGCTGMHGDAKGCQGMPKGCTDANCTKIPTPWSAIRGPQSKPTALCGGLSIGMP